MIYVIVLWSVVLATQAQGFDSNGRVDCKHLADVFSCQSNIIMSTTTNTISKLGNTWCREPNLLEFVQFVLNVHHDWTKHTDASRSRIFDHFIHIGNELGRSPSVARLSFPHWLMPFEQQIPNLTTRRSTGRLCSVSPSRMCVCWDDLCSSEDAGTRKRQQAQRRLFLAPLPLGYKQQER